MRIDLRAPDYKRGPYKVLDLDTGAEITHCLFADEETGEYLRWAFDDDQICLVDPKSGEPQKEHGDARLRILLPGQTITFRQFL